MSHDQNLRHIGSKLKVKTTLQLCSMAVLAGCRVYLQSFRTKMGKLEGVYKLNEHSKSLHHVASNKLVYCRPARNGASRHSSSDAKSGEDLSVRYLDGEDSGSGIVKKSTRSHVCC